MTPKEIINKAKGLGACRKIDDCQTWESLWGLLKSAQGREFCMKQGWPTLEEWREIKTEVAGLENLGIYIDRGAVSVAGEQFTLLIGETAGDLKFGSNNHIHRAMLMHGAKAKVRLEGWAVAEVAADAQSHADVERTENAILL
ncbi:MAG: hypothetical protein LIP09_00895 [Bacteroidales bacterium]|nr:hypothetical protein [Bacteroidales bacterium]